MEQIKIYQHFRADLGNKSRGALFVILDQSISIRYLFDLPTKHGCNVCLRAKTCSSCQDNQEEIQTKHLFQFINMRQTRTITTYKTDELERLKIVNNIKAF